MYEQSMRFDGDAEELQLMNMALDHGPTACRDRAPSARSRRRGCSRRRCDAMRPALGPYSGASIS